MLGREAQAAGLRRPAPSPVPPRAGQQAAASRRSARPGHPHPNRPSGPRSHFSPPPAPVAQRGSRVPAHVARARHPGHDGNCSLDTPRSMQPRASEAKPELQVPPRPGPEPPIPPGSRLPARGRPSPAVAADVAAPEPPPPPPPRWGAFRFLFFGIVGRPVPPTLGAQRGSADGAALSTRASVRRAAERRLSG